MLSKIMNKRANKISHAPLMRARTRARLTTVADADASLHEDLLNEFQTHQIELEMQIEALHEVQAALEDLRNRYADLYDISPVGYLTLSLEGRIMEINLAGATLLGVDRSQLIGHPFIAFVAKEDCDRWHQQFMHVRQSCAIESFEFGLIPRSGCAISVQMNFQKDKPISVTGFISDITDRKIADQHLRIAAIAFESQEGMLVTDAATVIQRVNRAFTDITGYGADEAVGKTPSFLSSVHHDANFYASMWRSIKETEAWQGEVWDRRKNGAAYPVWLTVATVKDDLGEITNYVATLTDITKRKEAEEEINNLAFYDSLTRLPNRRLLFDRLNQCQASSARSGKFGALLLIDLDYFKTINDTHGHDVGDLLLQQVAKELSACVREGDTIARLGGDEFVVMFENLGGTAQDAATLTEAIAKKILSALQSTYRIGAVEYRSSASIGVTLFIGSQTSIDDLLKQAELAMYKSKEKGRNTLRFFDPVMQTIVRERAILEAELRKAIVGNQLLLHYQAQVTGTRVTGVEALVRWLHPQRGMLPPLDFIPLAEETGLILSLGNWVLETACIQLAAWASQPDLAHLMIAVNVSAKQIREPDFVAWLLATIVQTGAPPKNLKLELTESLLVDNVEDIIEKMTVLKGEGVGFSLDDFGTGYSSLSYLKRLPLDQLKIDQSFVSDVLVDPNDAAIARTIVALADALGLSVIAEGVETEAQKNFLALHGCHAYQGYLFSRPLPPEEFEAFVRSTRFSISNI